MISILMPVFNTPKVYLEESLNSIYMQTFKNFELIIIDNGSTNAETKDILKNYKNKTNCSIYNCERQTGKRNISIALNYGLKKCKYEYVARMDSDDIMLESRLEKQFNYMEKNNQVDICGAQLINISTKQVSKHPEVLSMEYALNNTWIMNHPTVLFKKSKILKLGGYDEVPEFAPEDFLLWMKALKNNYVIHNLNEVLLFYRMHLNNTSQLDSRNKEWENSIKQAKIIA